MVTWLEVETTLIGNYGVSVAMYMYMVTWLEVETTLIGNYGVPVAIPTAGCWSMTLPWTMALWRWWQICCIGSSNRQNLLHVLYKCLNKTHLLSSVNILSEALIQKHIHEICNQTLNNSKHKTYELCKLNRNGCRNDRIQRSKMQNTISCLEFKSTNMILEQYTK